GGSDDGRAAEPARGRARGGGDRRRRAVALRGSGDDAGERQRPSGARPGRGAARRSARDRGESSVGSARQMDPRMHKRVSRDGLEDEVAVEEPLEIRVGGAPLAVTMRTPGNDEELALGFLHGEGLIDGPRDAGPPAGLEANTIEVSGPLDGDPGDRSFYTSSSCGVCGKGSIEQVAVDAPFATPGPEVSRDLLAALPEHLRQDRKS